MTVRERPLKGTELRVLSELMKNSRRTDRELARSLGVSQPTVSRIRHRLEEKGYIREYTVMPDLARLGYQMVAATLVKYRGNISPKEAEKFRKQAQERFRDNSFATNVIMFERGLGLGYTGVLISLHENYASYAEFRRIVKQFTVLERDMASFVWDLNDKVHYRPLTFAPLAQHILTRKNERKNSR